MPVPSLINEKDLVALLNKSDEKAFEQLYNLYSERLLGYIITYVKSETLSCEILQDTFVKIWSNRETIDSSQSFRSYLFRVAENLVYDFFRRAARDKKLQAELFRNAATDYRHVEETFFSKENARLLHEVIRMLPPKRRMVLQLIKVEGRSYEEVSKLLNISNTTISDHVVKATRFIREHLQEHHLPLIVVLVILLQY